MANSLHDFVAACGETLLAIEPERQASAGRDPAQGGSGIAVIGLQGDLTPRGLSFWGRLVVPGMDAFRAAGDRAAADPNVGAIVLDVNSRGGTYAGTPETASAVSRWAQAKPVIAVVDSLMASAAYFIGAQATQVVVSPSGEVGSLGVMAMHMDHSESFRKEGMVPTIIRSRASKADANPYEPLTPDAKAAIEASVMEADAVFLKAVAAGRKMTLPQVRQLADDGGAGRLLSAKRAVEVGLADRVATMSEVLSGLIKTPRASATRRRSSLAF